MENNKQKIKAPIFLHRTSAFLLMEATEGFEPSNSDFADRRLRPLGYVAIVIYNTGGDDGTRTRGHRCDRPA